MRDSGHLFNWHVVATPEETMTWNLISVCVTSSTQQSGLLLSSSSTESWNWTRATNIPPCAAEKTAVRVGDGSNKAFFKTWNRC